MMRVLFIGSKVRGFQHAESAGLLREIRIHSMMAFFGGEVKSRLACCRILWQVKDPLRYDRDTDRQNSAAISHPVSPCFTTRCLCYNQSRELWWMNGESLELSWGTQ
jgi:hypothetical protein